MPSPVNEKKYLLWVLGCQMNKSDAERIENVLELLGYQKTLREDEANIIGVVSCSVRQTSVDRIHGKMKEWSAMKAKRPLLTLLTGCVLPYDREHLGKKFDILLDISDLAQLPQMMASFPGFEQDTAALFSLSEYADYFAFRPKYHERFRAFVPIMSGCDKFCTYCAVPYTRGRERSRLMKDVVDEVRSLAEGGCLEVTLLGQNVNSYHPEDQKTSMSFGNPYQDAFAALLWEINQIPVIERIHFTAPHPKDMSEEVIDALTLPKHMNYLHLPMQSGDNDVLRRMNRKYTIEEFCSLVERIREKKPEIALGTDIIVGFCGETEEQFQHTVSAYQRIEYDISYNAMYSPRHGTVADTVWKDDVSREEKKRRWKALQELMEQITLRKNESYRGMISEVLVDAYEKGYCSGNNRDYKVVRFKSERDLSGQIVSVRITEPKTWILEGSLIDVSSHKQYVFSTSPQRAAAGGQAV